MSFYTGTQVEVLYTLPAAVTKNTYTTQAVFSAPTATATVATIPAEGARHHRHHVGGDVRRRARH